jgi:hypothetical protein
METEMHRRVQAALAVMISACLWLSASSVRAESEVDLALVLAVDVSRSMDPEEQELQRQGFIEAFRSPLVHDAIRNGTLGRITVTYMEWSSVDEQTVVAPWTIVDGPESATRFADSLSKTPIGRIQRTSISGAIDFGVKLLAETGVSPMRKVIDISGDGPNSSGRSVVAARDEATAQGVTINGLPIMLKRPSGFGDMENLDLYYRDCVIGGEGAFLVPVRERRQFAEAIRTKIIREIASLPEPLVKKAQLDARGDCQAGERRIYQWNRN